MKNMRTEGEIISEYDQEYQNYVEIQKTEQYIEHINYLIKDSIRKLNPRYPGTDKYDHAEIYPSDVEYDDDIEKRYTNLYKLWYDAPYDYEISHMDKIRINDILAKNFTLDKFKEVNDTTNVFEEKWREIQDRLLNEYVSIEKDMEKLLINIFDSYDYPMHPLLKRFVQEKCKLNIKL